MCKLCGQPRGAGKQPLAKSPRRQKQHQAASRDRLQNPNVDAHGGVLGSPIHCRIFRYGVALHAERLKRRTSNGSRAPRRRTLLLAELGLFLSRNRIYCACCKELRFKITARGGKGHGSVFCVCHRKHHLGHQHKQLQPGIREGGRRNRRHLPWIAGSVLCGSHYNSFKVMNLTCTLLLVRAPLQETLLGP